MYAKNLAPDFEKALKQLPILCGHFPLGRAPLFRRLDRGVSCIFKGLTQKTNASFIRARNGDVGIESAQGSEASTEIRDWILKIVRGSYSQEGNNIFEQVSDA